MINVKRVLFQPPPKRKSVTRNHELICNMESGIPFIQVGGDFNEKSTELVVKILYSHGNGEDLYMCKDYLEKMIEYLPKTINDKKVGYIVWAWDYPSYGESKKSFDTLSEETIKEDVYTIFERFKETNFTPGNPECPSIVLTLGYSLGCFPSLYIAKECDISGCIIMAPFQNLKSVFPYFLKLFSGYLSSEKFSNDIYIRKARCKVYTVQSENDDVINYRDNYKAFKEYSTNYLVIPLKKHKWFVSDEDGGILLMAKKIEELLNDVIEIKQ
mgnify:CR=1 FL=1